MDGRSDQLKNCIYMANIFLPYFEEELEKNISGGEIIRETPTRVYFMRGQKRKEHKCYVKTYGRCALQQSGHH